MSQRLKLKLLLWWSIPQQPTIQLHVDSSMNTSCNFRSWHSALRGFMFFVIIWGATYGIKVTSVMFVFIFNPQFPILYNAKRWNTFQSFSVSTVTFSNPILSMQSYIHHYSGIYHLTIHLFLLITKYSSFHIYHKFKMET